MNIGDILTYDDINYYKVNSVTPFSDGKYGVFVETTRCASRTIRNHSVLRKSKGKVVFKFKVYDEDSVYKKVDLEYLQNLFNENKEILGL